MIEIQVRDGHLEEALISLRRQCQRDAIHSEIKRRETFVKPSTRKKAKEAVARRRRIKTEARRERQQEAMAELRRVQKRRPVRGRGRGRGRA
jgi:small subunit ribosomal protein S21